MEFIDIPTEQTTAATDAIIAVIAIAAAVYLNFIGKIHRWKANLWSWVFGLVVLASILGSIVHGFKMSKALQTFLWYPLYLSLCLLVSFFIVAVVYDIWGEAIARRVFPIMVAIGVAFFCITLVVSDFHVLNIYKVVSALFALGGYICVAYRRSLEGAWLMVVGVLVSIIAAGVQASNVFSFTFIWSFDYNGVCHLIQMVGILFLIVGLRKALLSRV